MKVLIAALCSNMNCEKMEEKISEFEKAGYLVYVFDKAEEQVEAMLDLPNIVDHVRRGGGETIERIVVLSNVSEFIFTWYRCYNSLVDDFIYYLDENTDFENIPIIDQIPHVDFYEKLYNFDDIIKEHNQGKIYITINFNNFRKVNKFLLVNNNFQFFDDYCNFNFNENSKKMILNKYYSYNGLQYEFITSLDTSDKELIVMGPRKKIEGFYFDEDYCRLCRENYHLSGYLFITIYEMFLNDSSRRNLLPAIFANLKIEDDHAKEYLYRYFISYFQEENISFHFKITFLSLLVLLGIKGNIYYEIMQLLLHENDHIENHYPLLSSSLYYQTAHGLDGYKNLYHDREQELQRIINFYKKDIVVKEAPVRKKERILIHVSQLLGLLHAPTLLTLNYAKKFKKYYPDYEIKIFVDDMFLYHANEVASPYVITSTPSISLKTIHEEFLQGLDIDIYYSDYTKERRGRIKEDLETIDSFSPSVILAISTWFNMIRGFLYGRYPIIDLTVGGLSNSQEADLFIHCYEEVHIEQECIRYDYNLENLRKGKIEKYRGGVDFPSPIKNTTREEYKIAVEDFVMVTVGNRLDGEMDDQFIDLICSFIQEKSNVKWIIVGKAKLLYLMEDYSELVKKQIVFIQYEDDLAALYRLCDIYINPFRKHGGYSAGMAMNQELPIVTLCTSDDVVSFVGNENGVRNNEEYFSEMQRLYKDIDYRKAKGRLMKQRLEEEFSFKDSIDDIVKAFAKATENFEKRNL